jgi:cellulose synthase operon protein C
MRAVALGIFAAALALIAFAMLRPHPISPRESYANALAAIERGNFSAARNDAMAVIAADPRSPAAHMTLARAYLLLGDGLAAEGELDRAANAGIAEDRIRGARARARLLQGDIDGAVTEAQAAPPDDTLAARTLAWARARQGDRAEAETLFARLLAAHPHDAATLTDLGRSRLDAGDLAGAADAATRAAKYGGNDPAALTLQGELIRARYGLTAALPWFEAALKRDAYYFPALIAYAATLGDAGRYTDMLAATRKALAARPGHAQPLYLQAVMAARAGRIGLARTLLQRAGKIDETIPGAMLLSGALDYRDGRYEQAIDAWRRLIEAQPMNLTARRLYAAALLRSGDAPGALDLLAPVVARGDADSYSLTLAARAEEQMGDQLAAGRYLDRAGMGARQGAEVFGTNASLSAFAQGAAAAPADIAAQVALIRARLDNGDQAGAVDLARAMAARAPGDPVMLRALGDTLVAAGRAGEAAGIYARAADLTFDEPTMLRLVDALGRIGQSQKASSALSLYLQQNPSNIAAQQLRAHWLVINGEGASAIPVLEAIRLMAGSRSTALLTDLALAYIADGEGAVARHYAKAAYALSPLDPAVVDAYGLALAADKDVKGARQLFAKAMLLAPGNPTIRAHAAQVSH